MSTSTYLTYDDLKTLAGEDNEANEGVELPESFERYDIDFEALQHFGLLGVEYYLGQVDSGEIDPVRALMGMWFGGMKLGLLARDEQRRRIVEELAGLETPDDASELTKEDK